jgi:hypothetical protein
MEINSRRQKLQWLLASKRVMVESDALDMAYNDIGDIAENVSRADSVIVTRPGRIGSVHVETDLALTAQQSKVMIDAENSMQRVAGIFNSMLGTTDGATSGRAISSLVDQGNTMQAEVNDNYRFARTQVGQLLLEMIAQDMAGEQTEITVEKSGIKRQIVLNKPAFDALTGVAYRENDVSKMLCKVSLGDIPSTPAYRSHIMTMIAEVIKGLPPQLQAPLVPYFLESTDLPQRREMADVVRKVLGMGDENQQPDPEKQQMQQAIAQMQQAMQEGAAQVDELQKKLESKEAEIAIKAQEVRIKEMAAAADVRKTGAEIGKIEAETLKTRAETAGKSIEVSRAATG